MGIPGTQERNQTSDEKRVEVLASLDSLQKKQKNNGVVTKKSFTRPIAVGSLFIIVILGIGLLSFGDLASIQPKNDDNSIIADNVSQTDFSFQLLDESVVSLSDYIGKPIILDFFATWCIPCIDVIAVLKQVRSIYPQVQILSVSASLDDDLPTLASFKAQHSMEWVVGFDYSQEGAIKYQVNFIPTLVFINDNGIIRHWEQGVTSFNDLSRWIQQG
ncbi:MAG: redoxin domain-containing protein [Candidatus Heimdallarchaeota archaeon]